LCEQRFSQSSKLNKHKLLKKGLQCDLCEQRLTQSSALKISVINKM